MISGPTHRSLFHFLCSWPFLALLLPISFLFARGPASQKHSKTSRAFHRYRRKSRPHLPRSLWRREHQEIHHRNHRHRRRHFRLRQRRLARHLHRQRHHARCPSLAKPPTSHLYHNNHDGTFTDVTQKAGLTHTGWGQGVCVGDYDNDGWEDLYVTYYGKNVLYRNNGDGTFSDVSSKKPASPAPANPGAMAAPSSITTATAISISWSPITSTSISPPPPLPAIAPPACGKAFPVMCGPRGLTPAKNILYHNRGDGTFEDVTAKSHIDQADGHYSLSVSTLDYDNDGWPDIFVACDSTASILYHNNRDGTFTDVAVTAGAALQRRRPRASRHGLNRRRLQRRRHSRHFQNQFLRRHFHSLSQQR